ncbi:hypothetical protein HYPSUDRAFT_70314 [Hypholoma sublateritium FD-334 SS-4]|uniref:Uncharacterized protein n=1 Tax=Hypholoma sublateritium (strain FD-334 SS-4) TaxID=945553 RepID=A0A0D2NG34_HYPSF|nr:hypothetical protein HYPSUDRAFT_70314 [Hypholoma sublateritium FD-334 SS-4]
MVQSTEYFKFSAAELESVHMLIVKFLTLYDDKYGWGTQLYCSSSQACLRAVFADRCISQNLKDYLYMGGSSFIVPRVCELAQVFRVFKGCIADLDGRLLLFGARPMHTSQFSDPAAIDNQ